MEKIGHIIGSAIFFFVIGILSFIGIYLIYSAIHIRYKIDSKHDMFSYSYVCIPIQSVFAGQYIELSKARRGLFVRELRTLNILFFMLKKARRTEIPRALRAARPPKAAGLLLRGAGKASEADPRRGKPSMPRPAKQAEPAICPKSGPSKTWFWA